MSGFSLCPPYEEHWKNGVQGKKIKWQTQEQLRRTNFMIFFFYKNLKQALNIQIRRVIKSSKGPSRPCDWPPLSALTQPLGSQAHSFFMNISFSFCHPFFLKNFLISGCTHFSLEKFLPPFHEFLTRRNSGCHLWNEWWVLFGYVYSVNDLFFAKEAGSLVYVRIQGAGDTC